MFLMARRAGAVLNDVRFVKAVFLMTSLAFAIDRFDGRSEPFTWLYRIAVNLSLNTLRSRKASRAVYRATVAWLHFLQPFARGWGRLRGIVFRGRSVRVGRGLGVQRPRYGGYK